MLVVHHFSIIFHAFRAVSAARKYYKKALSPKTFGLEGLEEVVELVRDTVLITGKSKVLEAQLPEDVVRAFKPPKRKDKGLLNMSSTLLSSFQGV